MQKPALAGFFVQNFQYQVIFPLFTCFVNEF